MCCYNFSFFHTAIYKGNKFYRRRTERYKSQKIKAKNKPKGKVISVTQVSTKILYTTSPDQQFGTTGSSINPQSPNIAIILATITPKRGSTEKKSENTIHIL